MSPTPSTYEAIDAQIVRYRNMFWEVKDDFARNDIRRAMNMLEYERDKMKEEEGRATTTVPCLTSAKAA